MICRYCFGAADAIEGGGDDATGVAGAFATRIETLQLRMLQGFFVSGDAYGRRGAALDSKERGLLGDEAVHLAVEILETLYQAVDDKVGQHFVEGRGDTMAHVVALVEARGGLAAQEVDEPLRRGVDAAAGNLEGPLFDSFLKIEQGEGRRGTIFLRHNIFKTDGDGDAAVGEAAVAGGIAHTVDHLLSASGSGRHDDTTRAHAEGEDPVTTHLGDEAVGGRRQQRAVALAVVLYLVDELLGMLHADAEGEGLGLEEPAATGEEFVDVACRMAGGQDDGGGLYFIASGINDAAYTSVFDEEVGNTGVEMVFSSMIYNCFTHARDDGRQAVGADMGVDVDHDVGIGAMLDEETQHLAHVATLGGARIELAVAVGPGAALAEAPVAVGVHLLGAHQADNVALALFHGLAPFHDDGPHAQLQSLEGRKEARRAGTDDKDGSGITS